MKASPFNWAKEDESFLNHIGINKHQAQTKNSEDKDKDWLDWKWQLKNSFKTKKDFENYYKLSQSETKGFLQGQNSFKVQATPYYLSLIKAELGEFDPIRQMVFPKYEELIGKGQAELDPLGENQHQVSPRLIHRYSDRVLFLVTDHCAIYCRYCTRKHFTAKGHAVIKEDEFELAIKYISEHKGIKEVILSGGDPLTLSNQKLEKILKAIYEIPHVEIIRIGTRVPVSLPMRIDEELVSLLTKYQPIYIMTHFNHPNELGIENIKALKLLVDKGLPVYNQFVLLNGINNKASVVQALNRRLVYLRVRPYYMFQCDPSFGTAHLRVPISEALQIQEELWGHLSGLAMPKYSIDIPGGGGKTTLSPQHLVSEDSGKYHFKGWDGVKAHYEKISPQLSILPAGVVEFDKEWDEIQSEKL